MSPTNNTRFKRRTDMQHARLENCHGGVGSVDWIEVVSPSEWPNRGLKFIHDDRLAPGASIGLHRHDTDEEYYYFLSGQGIMTLDDQEVEVGPGDVTAVLPGWQHALKNTGDKELRFVVLCVQGGGNPEKHRAPPD